MIHVALVRIFFINKVIHTLGLLTLLICFLRFFFLSSNKFTLTLFVNLVGGTSDWKIVRGEQEKSLRKQTKWKLNCVSKCMFLLEWTPELHMAVLRDLCYLLFLTAWMSTLHSYPWITLCTLYILCIKQCSSGVLYILYLLNKQCLFTKLCLSGICSDLHTSHG